MPKLQKKHCVDPIACFLDLPLDYSSRPQVTMVTINIRKENKHTVPSKWRSPQVVVV